MQRALRHEDPLLAAQDWGPLSSILGATKSNRFYCPVPILVEEFHFDGLRVTRFIHAYLTIHAAGRMATQQI